MYKHYVKDNKKALHFQNSEISQILFEKETFPINLKNRWSKSIKFPMSNPKNIILSLKKIKSITGIR
jgi:hypothetical protein